MFTYLFLVCTLLVLSYCAWYCFDGRPYVKADIVKSIFFATNLVFTAIFFARLEDMFVNSLCCILSLLFLLLTACCYVNCGKRIVYYVRLATENEALLRGILAKREWTIFTPEEAIEKFKEEKNNLLLLNSQPDLFYNIKLISYYGTYWWKISDFHLVGVNGFVINTPSCLGSYEINEDTPLNDTYTYRDGVIKKDKT